MSIAPGYRELTIGFSHYGYVSLYRMNGNTVIIVAIRHRLEADYTSINMEKKDDRITKNLQHTAMGLA